MPALNSFFEKVFCINLARRPDRLSHALEQFSSHGISATVIPAVDGRKLPVGAMSAGRLGCLLSHLKIFRMARLQRLQSFAVFEDDVLLVTDFGQKFNQWISELPVDWDLVYLGWLNWLPMEYTPVSSNVGRIQKVGTSHAVGMRGVVLDSLIELVSERRKPVDYYYMDAQEVMKAYAFRESLAIQASFTSDVAD